LDHALLNEAVKAGATFLAEATARLLPFVGPYRIIQLSQRGLCRQARADVVLAADGLGGGLLSQLPDWNCPVLPTSWIGAGTALSAATPAYGAGTIYMVSARAGYVGLVRLEDGRLNIGAAFDASALRAAGGPAALAEAILDEAGMKPVDVLGKSRWRGTPPLSRRPSSVAFHRVFAIGDAAGYIEPLTGEGIGWALSAAQAVVPFAIEAASHWRPSLAAEWSSAFQATIARRQTMCRLVTTMVRYPPVTSVLVHMLLRAPQIGKLFVRYLHSHAG
jgi:flavin-dependent dehydrogenase